MTDTTTAESAPAQAHVAVPAPTTILDDFARWLDLANHATLVADVALLRYLGSLPKLSEHDLRLKQLGTRFSIEHESPTGRGHMILSNVSMRLQSALVDYVHDKSPEERAALWNTTKVAQPPESYL